MTQIHGYTKPGYEAVRDTFSRQAHLMGSGGAAFAATRGGETIVDLWAGQADHKRPWNCNTKVHIQSTSKAVTAFAAMLLVDRGELDLDERVSQYWPEYGCNGKENTTVRMLLSHASGSTQLPGYTELLDLDGNGLDQYDEIARRLAQAAPDWEPGTAEGYHGYTYGNLVSELVYRIIGKRAGEFLRTELFGPWSLNCWLGTPPEEQRDLAQIKPWPMAPMTEQCTNALAKMQELLENGDSEGDAESPADWKYDAHFNGLFGADLHLRSLSFLKLWSEPKALAAEFGSANVTSDARSLARLWTPLANEGVQFGKPFFKPETVTEFITPAGPGGKDRLINLENRWTPGSHHSNTPYFPDLPAPFGPNAKAVGMIGGGGNYGFADPEAGIAGGFVRNHYDATLGLSSLLVESLYQSL
ncbi:beta-lactamase family protein [Pseudomaricurvus alkylphenolicus]|uniref:serine hydrolase domain-containing protein n=1 Tax=Pseudomaricurvus alkylphenolicus TaxID=1306991 RepID=UPI00141E45CB|nr:serine hydrolase domain-containing protein [Pseudomaricurvus alkylphenolicus]NIB38260.1 beta-lactamase family protein [Pseudomaricurvus alkylphenolicus]